MIKNVQPLALNLYTPGESENPSPPQKSTINFYESNGKAVSSELSQLGESLALNNSSEKFGPSIQLTSLYGYDEPDTGYSIAAYALMGIVVVGYTALYSPALAPVVVVLGVGAVVGWMTDTDDGGSKYVYHQISKEGLEQIVNNAHGDRSTFISLMNAERNKVKITSGLRSFGDTNGWWADDTFKMDYHPETGTYYRSDFNDHRWELRFNENHYFYYDTATDRLYSPDMHRFVTKDTLTPYDPRRQPSIN